MTQLYIEGKLVDVNDDFDITLEKDFDNFDEHVVEEAHYSFEVELPITKANREALNFGDVFDVSNKFTRTFDAILIVDNVNILAGKFMLSEISKESYSGNLYVPAKATLKDVLGDKKLKDIKEHNMYIASWDDIRDINNGVINNQPLADKHICFPYLLYRLPYNNTGSTLPITTQDLAASGNTFSTENIFPAYNVLSILKDAFEGEGYQLQGNIFNIEKFTKLYQTFSTSFEDYHNSKMTPYYLSFHADYNMKKGDNISSTLQQTSMFYDPSIKVGADALLLSENTTITNEVDDYNMLPKGAESDSHSIIIPKTGWYRIKCSGNMKYPINSGHFDQAGRTNITGCYNDSDRTDLSQNIFEFQLKKTETPMSNVQYYSYNCATPMVPTNLDKESIGNGFIVGDWGGWMGLKLSYDDPRNYFAKNGKTAIVRDYSGFDVSEFIAGARLGCPMFGSYFPDSHLADRRADEMALACLPNPTKATKYSYTDDGGVEHSYMPLYTYLAHKRSEELTLRRDFADKTAQALVKQGQYSNFEGYNLFKPNKEISGGNWDTTTNYQAISYPGLTSNGATASTLTTGNWVIDTVAWLEEGDMISPEIVVPYNDYADKCGTFEITCDWKHRYNSGVLWTDCSFDFEMGIINSDEKWVPTPNNPVPSFEVLKTPEPTNVNQWLGDTKVNDYIENFLNTFNLRLSRISSKTYSIDTLANESKTLGNVIDIDKYAYHRDATFARIDANSTIFEWTISTDEEGYVHGNTTREEKTKREESGYTGGIEFVDDSDTSEKETKIKSNWSYTWMKDISFANGDGSFTGTTREVPVIGDAEAWENTYLSIGDGGFQTDKTSRLIYLTGDYLNVYKYRNDTTIPEFKASLPFCRNYLEYKNSLGDDMIFRLDYDNRLSTKNDRTITDTYFKLKRGYQYSVEVPVTLPNHVYQQIRSNTLVKFNDGLYSVLSIEGHDVDGRNNATLKLITLK